MTSLVTSRADNTNGAGNSLWQKILFIYLFRLYDTRSYSLLKMLSLDSMFEKLQTGEKICDAPRQPQPSNLCSNAYRSLQSNQDIFSLLFSCIYIHRNPRK